MTRSIDISKLSPEAAAQAQSLGARIRIARQRRGLRVEDVAEKATVSKKTVEAVEKGSVTTSLGAYLAVLSCMSLGNEIDLIADPGLDRDGAVLVYEQATHRVRPSRKLNNDF
jgi:transcriptional regulator with XRE-family HTH domain